MSKNKLYLLLISIIITKQYDTNFKPTIGIYAMPYPKDDYSIYNQTLVGIPYIRWLESSGANVLIIQQWYSNKEIDDILNNINGVLLIGDERNITLNQTWEKNLTYLVNKSLDKNIPIWATSLGFEIIHVLIGNKDILEFGFDDKNVIHSFNNIDYNSKMFSLFNQNLLMSFNESLGYFNHKFSINKTKFNTEKKLTDFFKITSYSKDMKSKEFINSVEGINKKIYANQFNPEKIPFQRKNYNNIEYEKNSIRVSTFLGIFFVEECRKNGNKFNLDKKKYYFIDSYENNNQNSSIDSKNEIIIFTHNKTKGKEQVPTKQGTNKTILIVFLIILIVIAVFAGIYLFIKNKRIQNNLLDENEISQYHFSK